MMMMDLNHTTAHVHVIICVICLSGSCEMMIVALNELCVTVTNSTDLWSDVAFTALNWSVLPWEWPIRHASDVLCLCLF